MVWPSNRTLRVTRRASASVPPLGLKRGNSTAGTRPTPRTRYDTTSTGSSGAEWPNIERCCASKLLRSAARLSAVTSPAGQGDLVALAGVAHVERALDPDLIRRKAISGEVLQRLILQAREHRVDVS